MTNTITDPTVEQYLRFVDNARRRLMGDKAKGLITPEGFVLEYGQEWPVAPPVPRLRRGAMGECFKNAAQLASRQRGYTYCEGYAMRMIPMLHAWCLDEQSRVVDPTWADNEETVYFGVPFRLDYVLVRQVRTNSYVSMIDNYVEGHPLLRRKHDAKRAVAQIGWVS